MALVSELQFAQRYSFSKAAKKILAENNLALEDLPEEVLARAEAMVLNAARNKEYYLVLNSSELLLQEILAFPIAKIIVSLQKEPFLKEKFSSMVSKSFLKYLDLEKHKRETALEIAKQLKTDFEFSNSGFFVSVQLEIFLKIPFSHASLKLVNQHVSNGRVFLEENAFFTFLSEIVFANIFNSLPVPLEGIPSNLKNSARQLQNQLASAQKKDFEFRLSGKINPNLFPTCMQAMYNDLASGKNLPHNARFYIAAFLNAIGMQKEQIIQLFSKLPNYSEKITRYQIGRIVKQNFSPPSCKKIREAGLCPDAECENRHPLGFYKRALESRENSKNKPGK